MGQKKQCRIAFYSTRQTKPERFNGTLRTECLNLEWFKSMEDLNEQIQEWRVVYNTPRPHDSIGFQTPDEFEQINENLYFSSVAT
jgi:putative transposase